ncbi:MAG: hypothetical protein NTY33_00335 [Candidatus Moranbacteria bacterium]|nr:hypothetical protein [Candidatus Moranbacteria bacterium]
MIKVCEQVDRIVEILKARGHGDNPSDLLNEIAKILGLPALGVAGINNDFKISHTKEKTPPHEQPTSFRNVLFAGGE